MTDITYYDVTGDTVPQPRSEMPDAIMGGRNIPYKNNIHESEF